MFKRRTLLLSTLPFLTLSMPVTAEDTGTRTEGDVLVIEEAPAGEATRSPRRTAEDRVPSRGMNKDNVRNVFGEPAREHAPVGDPPITRWDYADYSVFFEYNKVLHSVMTE